MLKEIYSFNRSTTLLDYEFYSDGPKGLIKKIVRFSPRNIRGKLYSILDLEISMKVPIVQGHLFKEACSKITLLQIGK